MKKPFLLPIALAMVILVLLLIFLLVPSRSKQDTHNKSQSAESADLVPNTK